MRWRRTAAPPAGHSAVRDGVADGGSLPEPLHAAAVDVLQALDLPDVGVVEVVGAPGAGRSTVLRHVAATLVERGRVVATAHPRTDAVDGPLGSDAAAGERLAPVEWITPVGSVVGVVDDAHHLDGTQASEVLWAIDQLEVDRLVVATSTGAEVPAAIRELRHRASTHTTRIRPFSVLDTMALLADLLGGPVAGETAARVQRDTGGRPGLIVELCRRGAEDGVFRPDERGRFRLAGEPPIPWTLTVTSVTDAVPDSVRAVLRLLAVADAPVPVAVARTLMSPEAVQRALDTSAVLVLGDPHDGELVHASPWVGAGIRSGVSEEQRQDMLLQLGTTILSDGGQRDVHRVRALRWLVRSGCPPPVRLLPDAVATACQHGDHRLAQELVELARASGLAADADAVSLLSRRLGTIPWRHGATAPQRSGQSALDTAIDQFLGNGRVDDLDHVVRLMSSTVSSSSPVGVSLAALRTSLLLSTNRVADAVAASDDLPLDRYETLSPRVAALIRAGRPVDAVRAAQRLERVDPGTQRHTDFRHTVYSFAAIASAYAGGLDGARRRARQQYESALLDDRPAAAAPWAYALGLIEQLAGAPEAALAALTDATGLMAEVQFGGGPTGHAIALVGLASAQIATGSVAAARETLGRIDDIGPVVRDLSSVGIVRGLLAYVDGDVAGARVLLLDSARQSAATGAHMDASWAYMMLACVGGAREAARNMSLTARQLQGPVLLGMYDAVRAVAAGSAEATARAADRLDDLGVTWFRAQLLSGGRPPEEVGGDASGQPSPDAGSPQAVALVRGGGEHDPAGRPRDDRAVPTVSTELTERQRQVASLVADGLSNAEVAVRLGISRRTVEVHLQLAYDKLGVHDRRLLAQARHLLGTV